MADPVYLGDAVWPQLIDFAEKQDWAWHSGDEGDNG